MGRSVRHKVLTRKKKKDLKDLTGEEKWNILSDYCKSLETNDICEKFLISPESLDSLISTLYKSLQNVRETRMLMATQGNSRFSEIMVQKYVDSEHINQKFLEKLSEPEEPLTDNEILFCEFLLEYGIDETAIVKSKLDIGLKKDQVTTYKEACKLRAFYLKKKPNISAYITKARQANLGVLEKYGKDYIQSQLITIIEQLGNLGDKSSLAHQLKAIESLAKTVGAFEDKIVIESANGDDAMDRLIMRAKAAQVKKEREEEEAEEEEVSPKMIAYVDGVEVYEPSKVM